MKVRFYLLDGDTNASSRHRALQYFPYLRQHGIQPVACRPVPEAVYQRLVEHRRRPGKPGFYGLFLACRLLDVLRANPTTWWSSSVTCFPLARRCSNACSRGAARGWSTTPTTPPICGQPSRRTRLFSVYDASTKSPKSPPGRAG